MLGHSSHVKEQRAAVQSELNTSYRASLVSKPSSIAPLCVSMILKQLSDAMEQVLLPTSSRCNFASSVPRLRGQLIK